MTLALWSLHEGCTIIERVKYWQYYQEETLLKGYQAKLALSCIPESVR